MLDEFAKAIEREPPKLPPEDLSGGEAWVWFCEENRLVRVRLEPSRTSITGTNANMLKGNWMRTEAFTFVDRRAK